MEDPQKEAEQEHLDVKEQRECPWKVPSTRVKYSKRTSSTSTTSFSFTRRSSFTTASCSGADKQEENEPSTSGCSSMLAPPQPDSKKEKKKARMQEYLKELKALVKPNRSNGLKMGTLSTLEQVLSSMKKIKEAKTRQEKKMAPTCTGKEESPYTDIAGDMTQPVYEPDSHFSSLKSSDELRVVLSEKYSVEVVSDNLSHVVGYPKDGWYGRTLLEYIHKKDKTTFRGACQPERLSQASDSSQEKLDSKVFYIRLRKYKNLGSSGFSLRKQDQYIAFQCSASMKRMTAKELELSKLGKQPGSPTLCEDTTSISNSGSTSGFCSGSSGSGDNQTEGGGSPHETFDSDDGKDASYSKEDPGQMYTVLYCVPLTTPYSESGELPEMKTFETRHSLFCSYCHVQPGTIPLLGYLPQEMIGVSIFDFYHNNDLDIIYKVYQKVITLRGMPYKSGPIRLRAKNGSYVTCSVEWSSFVNPWSNRVEFIDCKNTVIEGPDRVNIYSDTYQRPSLEDIPESVLQARKMIKHLLMQPVQTKCTPDSSPEVKKHKRIKTVPIVDKTHKTHEMFSDDDDMPSEQPERHCGEQKCYKAMVLEEAAISRVYEHLNYTNSIKKFLLGQTRQTRTPSSKQEVKRSFSDDALDFDGVNETGAGYVTASVWKHQTVPAYAVFDFDSDVPKPPSYRNSAKIRERRKAISDCERGLEKMPAGRHVCAHVHKVERHKKTRTRQTHEVDNSKNMGEVDSDTPDCELTEEGTSQPCRENRGQCQKENRGKDKPAPSSIFF